MAEDQDKKIIEGEILDEKSKTGKAKQYVSEKFVGLVVLVIVLIGAGYFAYGPVRDWVMGFFEDEPEMVAENQTPPDENQALKAEIERLQTRLTALENTETGEPEDLEDRFQALEEAIAGLSTGASPDGEGGTAEADPRIDALIQELAALRKEMDQRPIPEPGPNATYAQALAALSPALYESRPYEGRLEQVRILILEMPALNQATLAKPLSVLSAQARTGIPSLDELKKDFEDASVEALKVEGVSEDAGWWDKTWARVKGVVVVRRTDGGGSDLEQALATAQMHLEAGDLAKALVILTKLPAEEGKAFEGWIQKAEKRREALAAFNQLIDFVPRSAVKGNAE